MTPISGDVQEFDTDRMANAPELNRIYNGDCIEVMKKWPPDFIDTIITDPPYGLEFMGKDWDRGVPGVHYWQVMLRICKPGAMLLAFGGTRTFHRMTCAIEDAGFEIRDCLMWLYGSGFPKSLDISKAIDKAKGVERKVTGIAKGMGKQNPVWNGTAAGRSENSLKPEYKITAPATDIANQWNGWGTALKPAWEPIIVAMKPIDGTFAQNAEKWGVAGINVDGSRIPTSVDIGRLNKGDNGMFGVGKGPNGQYGKPIEDQGRWPANLILDEDAAAMLDGQAGPLLGAGNRIGTPKKSGTFFADDRTQINMKYDDGGGASRFFYVAKSASSERNEGCDLLPRRSRQQDGDPANWDLSEGKVREKFTTEPQGNHHPTVKPLSLMKYLCQLTRTPTGGIVLDPFAGSGTTLWAAEFHNRPWIGIELNPEYVAIAEARIKNERAQIKMAL